jgi:Ca2+-binding EF-hand superfamily protein
MTALLLLMLAAPAEVDLILCHEKQPPVWLRLRLPSPGTVRVRTTTALPMSAALTRALVVALKENDAARLLKKHDTDEDGVITPLELVPDLLTVAAGVPPARPLEGGRRQAGGTPAATSRARFAAFLKEGDWRDDLREHYGDIDETKVAALKPVEITLVPERRHVRRSGDLTIDAALTGGKAAAYTLWAQPQPRGWFEWLDADQDGQLSLMELRQARKRLTDDSGKLTPPDPKATHYCLTVVPASTEYGIRLRRPEGRKAKGPAWFVAMDRNGDGYVSRDEWLGTPEAFDKLDRNKDGLISPEEAEGRK